ncbi:MAG: PAC2 family protein [Nocardioidaceae bacterium]
MTDPQPLAEVVDPIVVVAFEGWNDAADAATGVIDHLIDAWDAEQLAEIDPEDYYDFQVNRPLIGYDDEGVRVITWPTTRLYVARPVGADRDLLLIRGLEPNMRWRGYCDELLTWVDHFGAQLVVTLGALLADSPHTRPVPVTGHTSDAGVSRTLDLDPSRYEGATGINGVFAGTVGGNGVPCVSLWAAVPHYVAQPPCPKATLALLGRLEDLLELSLPLGDLVEDARAWERGVDELAREDVEIGEYVEALEQARDTSELPEASGEAIAREFERYLKRRQRGSD